MVVERQRETGQEYLGEVMPVISPTSISGKNTPAFGHVQPFKYEIKEVVFRGKYKLRMISYIIKSCW